MVAGRGAETGINQWDISSSGSGGAAAVGSYQVLVVPCGQWLVLWSCGGCNRCDLASSSTAPLTPLQLSIWNVNPYCPTLVSSSTPHDPTRFTPLILSHIPVQGQCPQAGQRWVPVCHVCQPSLHRLCYELGAAPQGTGPVQLPGRGHGR